MKCPRQTYFYKKLIALLLCATFFATIITGCQKQAQPVTYTGYYFDTVIQLTFYEKDAAILADECFQICDKYEKMFSRTLEGSDIWRINQSMGTPTTVSDETYALIKEALFYCELTEGKIDITVAPLMDLWNFTEAKDDQAPPSQEEIETLLAHVNYQNVELGPGNTVTLLDSKASIDLGFIAKGYIADKLKEYLLSKEITSALINLGGNICAIGSKPDNTCYAIGIQQPFAPTGTTLQTLQITDTSVVTSGIYERYFTYDQTIYHHILDATTGYPVENTLTSVTILCPSSTRADALSTTCFVLGKEEALKYIKTLDDTECILLEQSECITYSYQ